MVIDAGSINDELAHKEIDEQSIEKSIAKFLGVILVGGGQCIFNRPGVAGAVL